MRRSLLLTAAAAGLLSTTACTPVQGPPLKTVASASDDSARADINPDYAPGKLNLPDVKIPSMQEMQDIKAIGTDARGATAEDRLRSPALRDAALSYGAIGGLAWGSKQINQMLETDAGNLSRTYDFNHFLIRPSGGVTILPPVISESRDTYEQSDAGRTLRVADKYYEILEQARFAPVAPLWHTYLIRSFSVPGRPNDKLLPKTAGERDLWRQFVAEGWETGLEQARETFKVDIRRLERDYTGMIRYSELLEKGMVSAPVVADQNLGVTGTGKDMRQNDRVYRITRDPHLNVDSPGKYVAPVSSKDPTEAATPPDEPTGERDN